ncbi:hypothetical protein [Kitasatospora sp. NPDC048538]|uniref:hypothetical protein n=1 Tax=unclassified Kitasatospora TaxID=2633591 RepID=UPI0033C19718
MAAAVALSVSIAVPAFAASASAAGSGKDKKPVVGTPAASPQVIELMKKQQVLDKVVDQMTGGLSSVDREKIPGFSEVEVDPATNHIRVHWKGTVPNSVQGVLNNLPAGVTAEVIPAKYTKAELHQARAKLLKNGKPQQLASSVTAAPTRITSIAPAVDGSGLVVGYDEEPVANRASAFTLSGQPPVSDVKRDAKTREVKAATDSLTGVETLANYAPIATDATRGEDSSPWWGGDGLQTPGGTICSSGFGVTRSDGTPLLTTAYHCGDGTFHNWYNGNFVGSTEQQDRLDVDDIEGINTGNAVGNAVYEGPWNQSNDNARYVSGWGHNNVGDWICQSGANGGTHCGIKIDKTDYSFLGNNMVWRTVADHAYQTDPNDIAAVNGDSGAPVYSYDSAGKIVARGSLTALDNTVNCNGRTVSDGGSRAPWCFSAMMYVPIYQILHDKGWTINTG